MTKEEKQKVQGQMRTMRLMYYALVAPFIFFGGAVYFLIKSGALGPPDYTLVVVLQELALLLVPALMATAYFLFRFLVSKIDRSLKLTEKLAKYFTIVLIRSALIELPFLYCCVAAFITAELLFIWAAPLIFLVFMLLRPTADSIAGDLELDASERAVMENQ